MNRSMSAIKNGFKKVSHVIFDLDGLLLDSETIYAQAIKNIAEQYGKEYTKDINRQILGSQATELAKIIVSLLELPITPEEFLDAKLIQQEKLGLANAELMPGAEKFVTHLFKNKVPMAVATSSSKESYELKVSKHREFFEMFHHKVTGASDPDVKNGKPHPDIFLICAQRFPGRPKPTNCLVFEDAPNGVTAARSAGMQCVMIPDQEIISPEFQKNATIVLRSLNELEPEIFGLPPY